VDDICDSAGLSKGSFYNLYNSKQEVFIDLLNTWALEVIPEIFEQFEASVVGRENSISQIRSALSEELHRGRTVIPLWLEFNVLAIHEESFRRALAKFYRRARSAIADVLRPSMRLVFSEDELQGVANVIFGAYMGLVTQEITDPGNANAEYAIDQFLKVLGPWLQHLQFKTAPPQSPEGQSPS
tara:strand:+ start:4152 stop:4703 length:552 start_codon:yes stop_codon:yes gene_type:complete